MTFKINRSVINSEYQKFLSEEEKLKRLFSDPDTIDENIRITSNSQKVFALIIGNHFESEIERLMIETFGAVITNTFIKTYVSKTILDTQIFRLFEFDLEKNKRKDTKYFTKKFSFKDDPLSLENVLNFKRQKDTNFTTGEGNFITLMDLRNKLAHNILASNPNNSIKDLYLLFESAANSIDIIFDTIINHE